MTDFSSYVELAVGVSCSCMPAVSTILRHYLPSYGTVKARVSAVIHHPAALPFTVKETAEREYPRKESSDSNLAGHSSQEIAASREEARDTQRRNIVTKISQDVEKQYPLEEDEVYLINDHDSCKSQHSTPANSIKQNKIGLAC